MKTKSMHMDAFLDLLAAVKAARANGTLGQTLTPAQLTAMLDAAIAKAEAR